MMYKILGHMTQKSGSITLSNFVNTTDYFVNCAKKHLACFMKTRTSFDATVCPVTVLCHFWRNIGCVQPRMLPCVNIMGVLFGIDWKCFEAMPFCVSSDTCCCGKTGTPIFTYSYVYVVHG